MGELTKSRAHLVLSSGQSALNGNGKGSNLKIMKESDDEESDDQETDDEWDADENSADLNKLGKSKKGNDFLDQFFDQLPSKKTEADIPFSYPAIDRIIDPKNHFPSCFC